MTYIIFYYIIMLCVFRSNHHCPSKFHKFHQTTHVLESLFFLKIMKLYKDICSAWKSCTFAKTFSSKIEVTNVSNRSIVIYGEQDFWEVIFENIEEKKHSLHKQLQTFWSFMKFYFAHTVKICFAFKKHLLSLYPSVYE